MDLTQFDYDLPESLIAQQPVAERSRSRLLSVDRTFRDLMFSDVIELLEPNDLLITNNTKVIAARFYGKKPTGGKVEIMLERIVSDDIAFAQIKSNKPIADGQQIILDDNVTACVLSRVDGFFKLQFNGLSVTDALTKHGQLPLPPYIKRNPADTDDTRYQTVYAKNAGAVAAPTAGLHFDEALLANIESKGVNIGELTLHVGAGTFQPVRVEQIELHKMHNEFYEISQSLIDAITATRQSGGRIIAVGTTTVRALESGYIANRLKSNISAETQIFIYPGFKFEVVDALITNFHLPKSTLLMMVSAFAGSETIRRAYQHAIDSHYRFFSYGDAMFLNKEYT